MKGSFSSILYFQGSDLPRKSVRCWSNLKIVFQIEKTNKQTLLSPTNVINVIEEMKYNLRGMMHKKRESHN